jgi:signal transduction histidine kinase
VIADADRLMQVVRNLVENGLKYGGDHVKVSARRTGERVQVRVEDDGVGIPTNMAEAIFDDFVQVGAPAERASSGFGLGLPISRRLVEAMAGAIRFESSPLGGACFVVDLPGAAVVR